MLNVFIQIMENGYLPDSIIRFGIRRLCLQRLTSLSQEHPDAANHLKKYANALRGEAVAYLTGEANKQHYEVPTDFFLLSLGKHRKYSCAFFGEHTTQLDEAEEAALRHTVERAQLKDGMQILELGCGWGSLTLYMAKQFPGSKIVGVSNSRTQKEYIENQARILGLQNVEIRTLDLSKDESFAALPVNAFDRVVSIEMFEHFKNYHELLRRISLCLKDGGKLFVHIFTHAKYSYHFETEGDDNWMGRYFFAGGQMPSKDLLPEFQSHLQLENRWEWSGTHYQKTAERWLENMDRSRDKIIGSFRPVYGDEAHKWFHRWRVFYISCAELFGYNNGNEWGVTHYLFKKNPS